MIQQRILSMKLTRCNKLENTRSSYLIILISKIKKIFLLLVEYLVCFIVTEKNDPLNSNNFYFIYQRRFGCITSQVVSILIPPCLGLVLFFVIVLQLFGDWDRRGPRRWTRNRTRQKEEKGMQHPTFLCKKKIWNTTFISGGM